ncbi:MAG: UDP-glucuronate 5-epimerase [Hirschia sp.]|nr:UDP-glucuronate 5-epimerase [Hirschia sp.]MBF19271.1 UDP-glucuronate 5-epimerase [Hirschia sp.]
MKVVVTGAAGFIGYHLALALLRMGRDVVGIDCVTDYYSPSLKEDRIARLAEYSQFKFYRQDIADSDEMLALFKAERPTHVVNLAAQAGVRYSLTNPKAYIHSNIDGFLSILEACRAYPVEHLLFASTSSVYGPTKGMPFIEDEGTEHPMTIYAATKKSNEMMAHTYSHLFGIPSTGLRFFTVYGPWGRPDMALFIFTKAILEGRPVPLFNGGKLQRDFTYVDDIVDGMIRLLPMPPEKDVAWSPIAPRASSSGVAPYRILNIGRGRSEPLTRFVEVLEKTLGRKATIEKLPMQSGDVEATHADTSSLRALTGFSPKVDIEDGINAFVDWYRSYYADQPICPTTS